MGTSDANVTLTDDISIAGDIGAVLSVSITNPAHWNNYINNNSYYGAAGLFNIDYADASKDVILTTISGIRGAWQGMGGAVAENDSNSIGANPQIKNIDDPNLWYITCDSPLSLAASDGNDIGNWPISTCDDILVPGSVSIKVTDTDTRNTTPLSERLRFPNDETILQIQVDTRTHSITHWRFTNITNPNNTFTVTTTSAGVVGTNFGNIPYGDLTELRITLDRARDWYLEVQIDSGVWSDRQLLDLRPHYLVARHDSETVITKTKRGAIVRQDSPQWTETRSSRGVTITPQVYSNIQGSNKAIVTKSNNGERVDNR